MGGGLALEGGVHGEYDFVNAPGRDAADQLVDSEILGPDAFQGGKPPAEDMIAAREQA